VKRINQSGESSTKLQFEELEARLLLSAGAEALVVSEVLQDETLLNEAPPAIQLLQYEDEASQGAVDAQASERLEVVFVDGSLPDVDVLLDDLLNENDPSRDVRVVVLDNSRNGIDQVSNALRELQSVDAIHFITHGSAGNVQIGGTVINLDNINGFQSSLTTWSSSLSDEADLLFYGCNLAAIHGDLSNGA